MLHAHTCHGAHRAAAEPHRPCRPEVTEVGRWWHRAVVCRDAGKRGPRPGRRALLTPHMKTGFREKTGVGTTGGDVAEIKGVESPLE